MSLVKNNDLPCMNHRIYDKNAEPYIVINSGESVSLDTNDAWSGVFTESCIATPEQVEKTNRLMAPATGPIVVNEATSGDWLKIKINKLQPEAAGVSAIGDTVCMLQRRFGPFQARVAEIKDGYVILNDRIKIPVRPMIGTIGTTVADEAPKIRYEGIWGGNLDVPTIGQGTEVWLPVFIEGAYLYVGDCHAIQGDGELLNPFELSAHIELTVELIKDKSSVNKWPRVINEDAIETVGVGNTFEKAVEIALDQMIDWLMEDYGFSDEDAAFFCGSVVNGRPGAIVNNKVSARCVIEKKYLPEMD